MERSENADRICLIVRTGRTFFMSRHAHEGFQEIRFPKDWIWFIATKETALFSGHLNFMAALKVGHQTKIFLSFFKVGYSNLRRLSILRNWNMATKQ